MIYYKNKEFNDNQFSIFLINEYLSKYFKDIESIKSKYTPKQIARTLGERYISFFCLYYLRDIFVVSDNNDSRELSEAHYEMWEVINKTFVDDLMDKLNMVEPRGMGKSTVCDLALGVWLHCYKKSKFTLMGAKKDDDATQFLDSIKKVFQENKRIIEEFGTLIDSRKYKVNANEIEFTNDTYIRAVGSASSVRGANWKGVRPTTVIADDYQSETDIITDDAREKKFNRWSKEVEKVGDTAVYRNGKKVKSATKIVSIGTVLHNDCLISRLARNKDYYTVLKKAIILGPGQTVDDIFESELWLQCKKLYFNDKDTNARFAAKVFYENNKEFMKFPLLWEEKWDFFDDIAIAYWENRRAFMSEMQNDATSIGDRWFKSVVTKSKEDIESYNFKKTMLCIDPASTQTRKSDYTAMAVGSISGDFKYIRKMLLYKYSFDEYCDAVIQVLLEYSDITHIYIEKNTFSGADLIKIKELINKNSKLRHKKYEFINEMQRKNKDEKISSIIDEVNNGQIIFVDDNKEAIQQILDFQGQQYSLHDDMPDVISELSIRLSSLNKKSGLSILK